MSIRVRFTLLYSAILASMLLIFGLTLLSIQSRSTYTSLQEELIGASHGVSKLLLGITDRDNIPAPERPEPKPFTELFDQDQLRELPEREIIRLLDAQGNLIASPFGDQTEQLPFENSILPNLAAGEDQWSVIVLEDEEFLLLNRPVFSRDSQNQELIGVAQVARSLSERANSLDSLKLIFFIASLITVLIASAFGWWLSSFLLLSIQKITQTAASIREENDLSRRVEYNGPADEVGALADTFNQMLESVEGAYRQVAQSLHAQREFVADVSHELRTPLTTIRGNLNLLSRPEGLNEQEKAEILQDASDETQRMMRLVQALLELARADTDRKMNFQNFEVSSVIEDVIRMAKAISPDRQINFARGNQPTWIFADRDAYKQILLIGLDNALNSTLDPVEIGMSVFEDWVETTIKDYGDGMTKLELERAAQRFYRGQPHLTEGFGLGLPIAFAITEKMHGELNISSEKGKGTTFNIRLSRKESLQKTESKNLTLE